MLTPERKQLIQSIAPMYRALYLGQEVFQEPEYYGLSEMYTEDLENTPGYLSLRSVKDLTEEEAIHVASIVDPGRKRFMLSPSSGYFWLRKILEGTGISNGHLAIDYLRSIGIALPYYTATTGLITVEEFIEAGTLVINPNQPRA